MTHIIKDEIVANLYLAETPLGYRVMIGDDIPKNLPKAGILMRWPTDPHFTGETGIIMALQALPEFKGKYFNHSKLGRV